MPARTRRRRTTQSTQSGAGAGTQAARGAGGRGNAARSGADRGGQGGFSLGGDLGTMAAAMGVGGGVLGVGDRGEAVRGLQAALGMAPEQQDGDFGRMTRAAVVAFQRSAGLSADGLAGPATMAALEQRAAPSSSAPAAATARPAATATPTSSTPATSSGTPPASDGTARDAGIASAAALRDATADGSLLRAGASGAAALEVQKLLGMEGAALTGTLDAATVDALKAFQRDAGLSVDGVVGPSTMGALLDGGAARDIEGGTVFELGDVGPGVLALQKALGMGAGGQTGEFGPTTREALLAFQEANGIQQTGRVGPTTWAKLEGAAFEGGSAAGAQGYDAAVGRALAQASLGVNGGNRRSMSLCYKYVADAVDAVVGRFLYGGHAYMAASQLAAKKELFTEVSASSLGGLPAGAIVVWGKGNSKSGHISIALGDGRESSDHVAPQMMSHYGGAGARIFLPKKRG